uniref:Uncharacterized protein n=1 Tax=Anguilla anguilla TaxID=7936 RepID=A0A0E9UN13_ANGAN
MTIWTLKVICHHLSCRK